MPLSSHDWLGCPGVPVLAAKTPDESPIKGNDCKACDKVFHETTPLHKLLYSLSIKSRLVSRRGEPHNIQKHIGTWHFASFEKTALRDPGIGCRAFLERFESRSALVRAVVQPRCHIGCSYRPYRRELV